jgi:hypothetical protein
VLLAAVLEVNCTHAVEAGRGEAGMCHTSMAERHQVTSDRGTATGHLKGGR